MLFETPFQLRMNYENLLKKLDKEQQNEKEIIEENDKKLEEFVLKEIELNKIIDHKENILKEKYLYSKDQKELKKTKEAHNKIKDFCSEIQTKFAKIIIQRETILIQVK